MSHSSTLLYLECKTGANKWQTSGHFWSTWVGWLTELTLHCNTYCYAPFSKRDATLICPFFLVPLGYWPWHRVFMILLKWSWEWPWALSKWCITLVSLAYTLHQKKCIFENVAFLLEKHVVMPPYLGAFCMRWKAFSICPSFTSCIHNVT